MNIMVRRICLVAFVCTLAVAVMQCSQNNDGPASAQPQSSTLAGMVVDESGKPQNDARVVAVPKDEAVKESPQVITGETDGNGKFIFEDVPPGKYDVAVVTEDGYVKAAVVEVEEGEKEGAEIVVDKKDKPVVDVPQYQPADSYRQELCGKYEIALAQLLASDDIDAYCALKAEYLAVQTKFETMEMGTPDVVADKGAGVKDESKPDDAPAPVINDEGKDKVFVPEDEGTDSKHTCQDQLGALGIAYQDRFEMVKASGNMAAYEALLAEHAAAHAAIVAQCPGEHDDAAADGESDGKVEPDIDGKESTNQEQSEKL